MGKGTTFKMGTLHEIICNKRDEEDQIMENGKENQGSAMDILADAMQRNEELRMEKDKAFKEHEQAQEAADPAEIPIPRGRQVAATVGAAGKRFAVGIMIEIAKLGAALAGICVSFVAAQAMISVAQDAAGITIDNTRMIVLSLAANVAAIWAWWDWIRPLWKRLDNLNFKGE